MISSFIAALAILSTTAYADDKTMTVKFTCEGECEGIEIDGNEIGRFPVTTQVKFDDQSDVTEIQIRNQSWLIAPSEGSHIVRIFDNMGMPTLIQSDTLSVIVNNPLVSAPQDLVPYFQLPIAECWYKDAYMMPGTNQRNWTTPDGIGCRWLIQDPQAVIRDLPSDAMLIGRYGHDYTGDTEGLDTSTQAIEDQARGWDIVRWADDQFARDLPAYPDTRSSLPNRKSELWVMIPRSSPAMAMALPAPPVIPEPCHGYEAMYPVDVENGRSVPGDKNLDGYYDAQDCQAAPQVVRKLHWEFHAGAGASLSAADAFAGVGVFLPVGTDESEEWIRAWASIGVTPDATSVTFEEGSYYDFMQFGVSHPVLAWSVGLTWIGPKGLTIGGTYNASRLDINGYAAAYDARAFVGYTSFIKKHGFWWFGGGPGYGYGHAPSGEQVWAFGSTMAGPGSWRTLAFGGQGGVGVLF